MRSWNHARPVGLACLAAALLLLASCQTTTRQPDTLASQWQPKRIALLPFQRGVIDASGAVVRSPLTGAAFQPGPILDGATLFMDQALGQQLMQVSSVEILPEEMAGRAYDRLRRQDIALSLRQAVVAAGKEVGADGVLVGFVYRFAERVGESFSAERPASAAFDLALIRVSDGGVVWKNSFDETQRALSEDVLEASQFLGRGVRWFTVQEWADYGLEQLLKRFPWRNDIKEKKES